MDVAPVVSAAKVVVLLLTARFAQPVRKILAHETLEESLQWGPLMLGSPPSPQH